MFIRKIFSLSILILFIVAIIYLMVEISKPAVISVGDVLESIRISDNDIYQFKHDKSTIVYLLSMNCNHCQYQVESLIQTYQDFEDFNVLLLFIGDDQLLSAFDQWPELKSISTISIHDISEQNVVEILGHGGVPRFYLFTAEGELVKKIMGEVKPGYLIAEMNSLLFRT